MGTSPVPSSNSVSASRGGETPAVSMTKLGTIGAVAPAPSNDVASVVISLLGIHTTVTAVTTEQALKSSNMMSTNDAAAAQTTGASQQTVPISVGLSSISIDSVDLTNSVSGSYTVVPAFVIVSHTVQIGSTVSVGGTPVAVVTSNGQTFANVAGTDLPLQQTPANSDATLHPIVVGGIR